MLAQQSDNNDLWTRFIEISDNAKSIKMDTVVIDGIGYSILNGLHVLTRDGKEITV